jgi:hypothetical protein
LGIGDWGLGIGDWGLGPIPNPQSPIPIFLFVTNFLIYNLITKYNYYIMLLSLICYLKFSLFKEYNIFLFIII